MSELRRHDRRNVGVRLSLQQTALGRIATLGRDVKSATLTQFVDRRERADHGAARRDFATRRDPRAAQHAGRRPLSVFRARGRQAGDRHARSHPQRRRRARRPEADHRRAHCRPISAPAGSDGLRFRPPSARTVGYRGGDARDRVRHEARERQSAQRRDRHRSDRLAAGASVNFTANPNPGDAITFSFTLPDGTSEQFTLTATNATPPAAGEFTIGATASR